MYQITALDEEGCAVMTALERLPFAKLFAVVGPAIEFCLNALLIILKVIHGTTKMGTTMMRMMKTVARISEMKSHKVHVILTLVLNFSRKWTIAFTGSTALCSVVPVIATNVMTGISLSNFSFSLRFKSKLKVGTKNANGLRFNDQQLMLISINGTNNIHMTT